MILYQFLVQINRIQNINSNVNSGTSNSNSSCIMSHRTTLVRRWYNMLIVQRIIVGSCLVFLLDVRVSLLLNIGVFGLFITLAAVFKPYLARMHNVRFVLNMSISIAIQLIYLAYRMQTLENKTHQPVWLLLPLVILIMLLICVIYNMVILVYELVRRCCAKDNKMSQQQQKQLDDEFKNITKEASFLSPLNNQTLAVNSGLSQTNESNNNSSRLMPSQLLDSSQISSALSLSMMRKQIRNQFRKEVKQQKQQQQQQVAKFSLLDAQGQSSIYDQEIDMI